ncbi:MAG: shikimate kinase [Pseudomonadota bacterium]
MMRHANPVSTEFDRFLLNRTLVLIGLMGAGKTSVGKRVAALLEVPFVDSDVEIEAAAGMPIPEIFARYGEEGFRDGERRVIARLLTSKPHVLATGGGAFIQATTRDEILELGTSVWLRADVETLWQRVRGKPGRPLLETPDPRATLEALHRERAPVYALADVTVDSPPDASHQSMAERILASVWDRDARHPDAPQTLEKVLP